MLDVNTMHDPTAMLWCLFVVVVVVVVVFNHKTLNKPLYVIVYGNIHCQCDGVCEGGNPAFKWLDSM